MWSGALGAIPAGFHLCDGAGGTLDLRDQFIIGPSPDIGLNQGDSDPGCDYGAIDLAHTHDFSATQIYDTDHFHDFTSDGLDSGGGAVDSGNAPTAVYDNSGAHTHAMATFADQHVHPTYSGEHNHTGAWDHADCDEARIDDSIVWQQGEPGPLQLGLPYYYALAFIQRIT